MRIWFDTEFMEDGVVIELLSIGAVAENGRVFYVENADADHSHANEWVRENVLPYLRSGSGWSRGLPREQIAAEFRAFASVGGPPEFWGYYCVAPETLVLTADLRWVEAGGIELGDRLMGFDEQAPLGVGRSSRWRNWRETVVEGTEVITRPCYDLVFQDGTEVRCSADHRWLTSSGEARWLTTEQLRCEGPHLSSNVVKPLDVWATDTSRAAGYLAAAIDGEGHLTQTDITATRGVARTRIGFAQNDNPMLAEVAMLLDAMGFTYTGMKEPRADGLRRLNIGNRHDVFRFLGSVRPVRLLAAFDPGLMGAMSLRTVKLARKTPVGEQPVVALRTTTGTFIAEGLASHNCDYDWVVLCQLFGRMIDLPAGWPMFAMDVKQLCVELGDPQLPPHVDEHHALADAKWTRKAWEFLESRREKAVLEDIALRNVGIDIERVGALRAGHEPPPNVCPDPYCRVCRDESGEVRDGWD